MIKKNLYFSFARQKGAPSTREGILSKAAAGSKFERFKYMLPHFQNHKFYFPNELKNTEDMREAIKQLTSVTYLGFSTHDDFDDVISQLGMIDYIPGSGNGGESIEDHGADESIWGLDNDEEETSGCSTIF